VDLLTRLCPVMKPINMIKPNELPGKIHLSKKAQGSAPDRLREVNGLTSQIEFAVHLRLFSSQFL
jgi:hypothetical protein